MSICMICRRQGHIVEQYNDDDDNNVPILSNWNHTRDNGTHTHTPKKIKYSNLQYIWIFVDNKHG